MGFPEFPVSFVHWGLSKWTRSLELLVCYTEQKLMSGASGRPHLQSIVARKTLTKKGTYASILGRMNTHVPPSLMFTRVLGTDPQPNVLRGGTVGMQLADRHGDGTTPQPTSAFLGHNTSLNTLTN